MSGKKIYDNTMDWMFRDGSGSLKAAYYAKTIEDTSDICARLAQIPFTRVKYINRFGQYARTPRQTWAYGTVDSEIVTYTKGGKTLNFRTEPMPPWLDDLARKCRSCCHSIFGFDPEYNSCIIGMYQNHNPVENMFDQFAQGVNPMVAARNVVKSIHNNDTNDKPDQIAFHFDTESFLAHTTCANMTFGDMIRDFQFRDATKQVHEIALANSSLFFFDGLEHALPARANPTGNVRYSISFRNFCNDWGPANSYYYCRGLDGAIDDEHKAAYMARLQEIKPPNAI